MILPHREAPVPRMRPSRRPSQGLKLRSRQGLPAYKMVDRDQLIAELECLAQPFYDSGPTTTAYKDACRRAAKELKFAVEERELLRASGV